MRRPFYSLVLLLTGAFALGHFGACRSGQPDPQTQSNTDTLAVDPTVNAPVFMDEKTHEMQSNIARREAASFYQAIPDRFLPVPGKPADALRVNDTTHQYLFLQYDAQTRSAIRMFRDRDTGREYLAVFNYRGQGTATKGEYFVLLLKARHCIDVTAEMLPRITPSLVQEAWVNRGSKAPAKPTWVLQIEPQTEAITVRDQPDGQTLITLGWKYGRFNIN